MPSSDELESKKKQVTSGDKMLENGFAKMFWCPDLNSKATAKQCKDSSGPGREIHEDASCKVSIGAKETTRKNKKIKGALHHIASCFIILHRNKLQ